MKEKRGRKEVVKGKLGPYHVPLFVQLVRCSRYIIVNFYLIFVKEDFNHTRFTSKRNVIKSLFFLCKLVRVSITEK